MAYVGEPFAHDLFVSYSHGDPDGSGLSRLGRWSQGFVRELESELKSFPHLSRTLALFIDQHHRPSQGVDPMAPLTPQLRLEIECSALLVVLMSPDYLLSDWCSEERDWWCERQRKAQLLSEDRIAVVRIWPTDDLRWPSTLTDERGKPLVGFWFYDRKKADLTPQPYGWPEPGAGAVGNEQFRQQLIELVGRIQYKLVKIRERLNEQRKAREQAERLRATGQVVYLHGRPEFVAAWDQAANELTNQGMVVMPSEPDPVGTDPHAQLETRRRRVETMSGCDAVLLVGAPDPRAVDADLVVVGRHDRNSARALSNHPLPCALLDRVGDAISTPSRRAAARSLNVDWIDATQSTWVPVVQEWLVSSGRSEATA